MVVAPHGENLCALVELAHNTAECKGRGQGLYCDVHSKG